MRFTRPLVIAVIAAMCGAAMAAAQAVLPTGFSDQTIASGISFPTSMAALPDGRVLFTQKNQGRVRLIVNGALVTTPGGTVDSIHVTPGEGGPLGVAIDPGFPARPYVYVQYDYSGGPYIRISRYTVSGDLAFTGSGTFIARPFSPVSGQYPIVHATFYAPGAPRGAWGGVRFKF